MNKVLTILVALFALLSFSSCGDDDSTGKDIETKNFVIGNWCYSEDNSVYSVEFRKDGAGSIYVHTYELVNEEHKWVQTHYPFLYTLSDNQLTAKIDGNETLSATVGITGNSLSITNSNFSVILTRYTGNGKIEELKKEIEDNWLDLIPPEDNYEEEHFFNTEKDILMAINGLYYHLRDYEYQQLNLENIRLTGKDFRDVQCFITPRSSEISNAWSKAYSVINLANIIIQVMDRDISSITEPVRLAYKNEALVLRSILYYNISHLWGRVPYITQRYESIQDALDAPVYTHKEVCEALIESLNGIDILPQLDNVQKNYRVNEYTIQALLGEIELSLGNKTSAKEYFNNASDANFSIAIDQAGVPEMYARFGEYLQNYTSTEVYLLSAETLADNAAKYNDLLTQWQKLESQPHWGYWAMLKRTNQAQQVSGCKEHELLTPIPEAELMNNPNMTQNPGYNESYVYERIDQ